MRESAHPRSRGENSPREARGGGVAGSSPLTRGKLVFAVQFGDAGRLIPAHAGKTTRVRPITYGPPAHPRSRGENEINKAAREHAAGSSPLTRGKPQQAALAVHALRLIPAHAGKTSSPTAHATRSTAHPRSRGENQAYFPIQDTNAGSSPLTRGKRVILRAAALVTRLIPAHAGKTLFDVSTGKQRRAHPRSRGENTCQAGLPQNSRGSSPLTRGKLHARDQGPCHPGLIPAHAGKTRAARVAGRRSWAHPRSRGENAANIDCVKAEDGSSPLTRGKRAGRAAGSTASGLIPAHAGKTRWTVRRGGCRRAHPRSRGENTRLRRTPLGRSGSSPLTRGKRRSWSLRSPAQGLIPAHAGKTRRFGGYAPHVAAHPRSRGENGLLASARGLVEGSSPLTRGKRLPHDAGDPRIRLIPAHAGKTPFPVPRQSRAAAHPRSRGEN